MKVLYSDLSVLWCAVSLHVLHLKDVLSFSVYVTMYALVFQLS